MKSARFIDTLCLSLRGGEVDPLTSRLYCAAARPAVLPLHEGERQIKPEKL
jgi:hypothetical protein